MSVLKRDFLPDDLIPELRANRIDGSIAVQAGQSDQETLFLLELASRFSEIKGVVGWVDLCSPEPSADPFAVESRLINDLPPTSRATAAAMLNTILPLTFRLTQEIRPSIM